jgi:hypothetical protein
MAAIIPDAPNAGAPTSAEGESIMTTARPLPATGEIFLDARGGDRALRVSWHHEAELVVLSLWRDNLCAGSFRLAVDEVPALIDLLRAGLDAAYDVSLRRRHA